MKKIEGDVLRGHLELLVLSVLHRGETHGYEILQRLERQAAGALRLKEGTLYPALYRLENAGLVRARWEAEIRDRKGPRRLIYCLTAKGRRRLDEQRRAWEEFTGFVTRVLETAP